MKTSLLEQLKRKPADIFYLVSKNDTLEEINSVTKALLDPIAKDHSVLDEVYTEGLDSTQVWGQTQMILLNIGESYLFEEIPKLREKYSTIQEAHSIESSSDEDMKGDASDSDGENVTDEDVQENESRALDFDQEHTQSTPYKDHHLSDDSADSKGLSGEEILDSESERTKVPSDSEPTDLVKDTFGLNDGFFDIDRFNKQIVELEDIDEPEGDIDFFAELDSDVDDEGSEQDMDYYSEFFDDPGRETKKLSGEINSADDADDNDSGRELEENEYEQAVGSAMLDLFANGKSDKSESGLSSFEKQQQELLAEISALEAELIAEKKWTMKGEVKSADRPADSLLNDEEVPSLEFDRTSKPVPVITDEVTETIEDLIKRRIRNDEFDDLPRRLITDVGKFVQRKKAEVSDQKSAKSLAEIYEDEFHGVEPTDTISDEITAAHDEITDLFTKLSYKLDSLCLAHYIPKPNEFKSIEVKVTDAPASISMEDAQPLHVSEELKLAPQEIYRLGDDKSKSDGARGNNAIVQLKSGLSFSKDELDRDDKQRLRRAKKRAKSKHFNELKDAKEQKQKQSTDAKMDGDKKRRKVDDVVDTLSKAKNLTVIDKKGQLRDAKGNLKKSGSIQSSNDFRL